MKGFITKSNWKEVWKAFGIVKMTALMMSKNQTALQVLMNETKLETGINKLYAMAKMVA